MSEISVTGKYLKDSEGNTFSPITSSKTVFLEDETDLETKISTLPSNLKNGSTSGSLRTINSATEDSNYTIGQNAFAEGNSTIASGEASHAEGQYTKASSNGQHVQGKYNIEDSNSKYAHIVGNGTADNARSNAHTIDWNGNGWFVGNVYVRGTDQNTNSHVLIADDTLVEYKYRDKNGVLDQNNLMDYIKEKYDNSCSGIANVSYYGQPGNDVMYAVYYYQNGYLTYEPIGIYKYHSPDNNSIVWIDDTTRSSENGSISNAVSDTNSTAYLVDLYTTNLTNIIIQYNGGGRFPEYHDITTSYTISGTNATCVCNGTNFSNYDSIRAKITYSDGSISYTDDYATGGGVVCFTGNTLIETENGYKKIEDIEVGDKVYSYNFEDKEIELKEVDKIYSHTINEIVSIYTEREIIEATKSHPFYVAYNQKKLAKNLKPNDLLRTKQNLFRPVKQVVIDEVNDKEVYEIRVKDNHNYFVGSEGILVYNEPNIIE